MVLITSCTLRVTFIQPESPAQRAPMSMAVRMIADTCKTGGRSNWLPTCAAMNAASTYWPSTPMLKRFIRKPIATATPERYSGVDQLMVSTSVLRRTPYSKTLPKATNGFAPEIASTMEETTNAKTSDAMGGASASQRSLLTPPPLRRSCRHPALEGSRRWGRAPRRATPAASRGADRRAR